MILNNVFYCTLGLLALTSKESFTKPTKSEFDCEIEFSAISHNVSDRISDRFKITRNKIIGVINLLEVSYEKLLSIPLR